MNPLRLWQPTHPPPHANAHYEINHYIGASSPGVRGGPLNRANARGKSQRSELYAKKVDPFGQTARSVVTHSTEHFTYLATLAKNTTPGTIVSHERPLLGFLVPKTGTHTQLDFILGPSPSAARLSTWGADRRPPPPRAAATTYTPALPTTDTTARRWRRAALHSWTTSAHANWLARLLEPMQHPESRCHVCGNDGPP